MAGLRRCTEELRAPLSMLLVQAFTTGMMIMSKLALNQGTFILALLAYRNAVGALFVLPFALFLERGMGKKLGWLPLFWIFINAMFGILMATTFYYYGLRDTTAAYSANFLNLIPVVTFIVAVITRTETLCIKSRAGKVKLLGALLCVGGAMVVSLYKGKIVHIWPSHTKQQNMEHNVVQHHWMRGSILLLGSCMSYALWYIVQVKLFKVYPSKYWATMLTCLAGCFQTLVIGISINREKVAWRLKWDLELLTIIYSGALSTGATFCLVSWVISRRGPAYPSMFNPLAVVFTTILESLVMGQDITTGSVLGTFLIMGGLWSYLWGKTRELPSRKVTNGDDPRSPSETQPQFSQTSSIQVSSNGVASTVIIMNSQNGVNTTNNGQDKERDEGVVENV